MANKIESLRGMDDILPGEVEKWQWLEQQARIFLGSFGFREIRTPILEYTELFSRSAGEASDIVSKEMFSFKDRGDRDITLRPEMTASVARSVIEKGLLSQAKNLFLYYIAPMFRAERPQAGRKRQFHQIGAEIINIEAASADLFCIETLYELLKYLGVQNILFKVNDLGDATQQQTIASTMREFFASQAKQLCKDCHYRLEKNVLRILDCKNLTCQPVIESAPWDKIAPLSPSFVSLTQKMDKKGIPYKLHRRLVRGLDYYNGFVFEVTSEGLGAQDALAGGGRYDRLYEQLGGKTTSCTGFSIGLERLLLAMAAGKKNHNENFIYLVPHVDSKDEFAIPIHNGLMDLKCQLNALGMTAFYEFRPMDLRDHMKAANKKGAGFVVIVGPDEFKKDIWTIKNMNTGEQTIRNKGELFFHLKGMKTV